MRPMIELTRMKTVTTFLEKLGRKEGAKKTRKQIKEELLFQEGREQFKALIQRGLTIPVVRAL